MLSDEASMTAKVCAFARAHHSYYAKEKIYDDYLAYDMIGKEEYEHIKEMIVTILSNHCWQIPALDTWNSFLDELISPIVLSRIKYAENYVLEYAGKDTEIQYVICGAGMDTFAFRNANPNIEIYELDHPNTHNYKLNRIKELQWNIPKNVQYISIDFERQNMIEKLLDAGFIKDKKTIFSILGVAYYLDLHSMENTINHMSKLTDHESIILMDYPVKSLFHLDKDRTLAIEEIANDLGEKMKGGMEISDFEKVLKNLGFHEFLNMDAEVIQKQFIGISPLKAYKNVNFIAAKKHVN